MQTDSVTTTETAPTSKTRRFLPKIGSPAYHVMLSLAYGSDQRGALQAHLAGVVGGGATSGTWSGGGGTFSPSASALNATYTPTAAEIAAASVTLTLTTAGP